MINFWKVILYIHTYDDDWSCSFVTRKLISYLSLKKRKKLKSIDTLDILNIKNRKMPTCISGKIESCWSKDPKKWEIKSTQKKKKSNKTIIYNDMNKEVKT